MKKLLITLAAAFSWLTANAVSYNLNVDTWLNDSSLYGGSALVSTSGGTTWSGVYAGQFEANFVGTPAPGYGQSFVTYCTDVNNGLSNGLFEPLSWAAAATVPHNPLWTGSPSLASSIYLSWLGAVNSNADAVGVQLAIWDALQDGGDGPNSGLFRSTTDFSLYLTGPLATSLVPAQLGTLWEPVSANGNYRQAQGLIGHVSRVPDTGNSVAMLALGLIGIGAFRRK